MSKLAHSDGSGDYQTVMRGILNECTQLEVEMIAEAARFKAGLKRAHMLLSAEASKLDKRIEELEATARKAEDDVCIVNFGKNPKAKP